jgi:hypothetical protein
MISGCQHFGGTFCLSGEEEKTATNHKATLNIFKAMKT